MLTIRTFFSLSLLALLTACGGGGGGESNTTTLYGAIATRTGGLESGVVGGQVTQADANALAINACGNNCEIKELFVGNKCGGTAYSSGARIMAWATANTQDAADSQALLNCISEGGTFCSVYRGACNNTQTSSSTSGGVCIGSGTSYVCQSRICTVSGGGVICPNGQYCPFAVSNGVTSNPVCASR